jgi:peptide/nickel transport system permease protein
VLVTPTWTRRRTAQRAWGRFLFRRIGRLLGSVFALLVGTFAMVHLIPGDPVRAALGVTAPADLVASRRHSLGLDQPLLQQFWHYVAASVTGDFGVSMSSNLPVSEVISERLPNTLSLAGLAFVVIMSVSTPLGIAVASLTRDGRRRGAELAFTTVTGVLVAVPEFLVAVGCVALFGVLLAVVPVAGRSGPSSYVFPVTALALGPTAALTRIVRVETLRVSSMDYMRTARSKRLPARLVYLRHALPNLLTASLTIGGLLIGSLVAGTVLVENVFAWPGLGMTFVDSISAKDYPLVQGIVIVLGAGVLVVNLLVDVLLAILDPRSTIMEG